MLRTIACIAMLIDHIGVQYDIMFFQIIGRIAFPIFVYLICNGLRHTANPRNYALRLAIFALLSQVPYSLFLYGEVLADTGNVFFTLLLALLSLWSADELHTRFDSHLVALLPALIVCLAYHLNWIVTDHGARGVIMAMVFYYFDGRSLHHRLLMTFGVLVTVPVEVFQACGNSLLLALQGQCFILPQFHWKDFYQIYSMLALIFIFSYNGKKGDYPGGKVTEKLIQYSFYAFYPVHQLVLWLINICN